MIKIIALILFITGESVNNNKFYIVRWNCNKNLNFISIKHGESIIDIVPDYWISLKIKKYLKNHLLRKYLYSICIGTV